MDKNLRSAAAETGSAYISPVKEDWLTADNFGNWIDVSKANHPTTAGHAYLAEKMIADLDALNAAGK